MRSTFDEFLQLKRDEGPVLNQEASAAQQLIAGMPEFWKHRFEMLVRKHGNCRRGRRATGKLLKEYGTWLRQQQARAEEDVAKRQIATEMIAPKKDRDEAKGAT